MKLLDTPTHKIETSGRPPNTEEKAIIWRDSELLATDDISGVADHPQHDDYIAYRAALRDWPSTENFPTTKPEL